MSCVEGEGLSVFDYRRFCGQIASVGLLGPVLLECVGRHVSVNAGYAVLLGGFCDQNVSRFFCFACIRVSFWR